jgi:hypothetical protein
VTASALACLLAPAAAHAADPGRWNQTGQSRIPLQYYQGVTSDPAKNLYFDGIAVGLYRTDSALNETARNDNVIPPSVNQAEGYNHVGDLSWDAAEGGRLLLPLECFYPGQPNGGNTCGTGSIGVADPQTLAWRYYVKLDERDIAKAMWAEISPDGTLVWTSAGSDLIAFDAAEVTPANAAPSGPKLRPVRRLAGAVPPGGITGATFDGERLLVAGQSGTLFRVWSIDTTTGTRELEIERAISGESEGLDTVEVLGGVLHWQIQPFGGSGPPTYPNGTLLHFAPPGYVPPPGTPATPPSSGEPDRGAPPQTGAPQGDTLPQPGSGELTTPARIRLAITPNRVSAGERIAFRIRTTALRGGKLRSVPGALVRFGGRLVRTDEHGRALVNAQLNAPGLRQARAGAAGMLKGSARVRVRAK